jgi:hypothetical protein
MHDEEKPKDRPFLKDGPLLFRTEKISLEAVFARIDGCSGKEKAAIFAYRRRIVAAGQSELIS